MAQGDKSVVVNVWQVVDSITTQGNEIISKYFNFFALVMSRSVVVVRKWGA